MLNKLGQTTVVWFQSGSVTVAHSSIICYSS